MATSAGDGHRRRLLVHVTGDKVGDGLIKLPVIRGLKAVAPEWHLTWVTGRRPSAFAGPLRPLVGGLIDELIERVATAGWRRPVLPGRCFDAVVHTGSGVLPALQLRRVRHGVFVSPALGQRLSTTPLPPPAAGEAVDERLSRLLSAAVAAPVVPSYAVRLERRYLDAARRLLPPGRHYVGFAPGAGKPTKRWPLARYVELARRQVARGRVPVFFLGPAEAQWQAPIGEAVPQALFPESQAPDGLRGPVLAIALAQRLCASVANDAGPGHILAAAGRPVVTLFGPTSADKFATPRQVRVVISAQAFGSSAMDAIPLAAVDARLEQVLASLPDAQVAD